MYGTQLNNRLVIDLFNVLMPATKQAKIRQQQTIQSSQSKLISNLADIYRPANRSVAEERFSYGTSSVIFQVSSGANKPGNLQPSVPASYTPSSSGTTMYVPLPQSSAQLPIQRERAIQPEPKEKKSGSIGSTLKNLFGK